jgi:hypothetical protein
MRPPVSMPGWFAAPEIDPLSRAVGFAYEFACKLE